MSDEISKLGKDELVELLRAELYDDWQPDYPDGFPMNPRAKDWPMRFKLEHFEIARILAAVELLPMDLSCELHADGTMVWTFTQGTDMQELDT